MERRYVGVDEMDIGTLIEGEYEARHRPRGGRLFCNEEPYFYDAPLAPIITQDMVSIDEATPEGIKWSFEIDLQELDIETGSLTSSSRYTLMLERYKLRHEFVCETLNRLHTSDQLLKSVFPAEKDEDDILTPDFIWKDHFGVYHVVEVATTRSTSEASMRRVFDMKMFKYRLALENRAIRGCSITYTILVVSSMSVLSSIGLSDRFTTELVVRMRIGLALEDKAKGEGLSLEASEGETQLEITANMIKGLVDSLEYKKITEDPLIIDEAYALDVTGGVNEAEVFDTYVSYYQDSVGDVEQHVLSCQNFELVVNEFKDQQMLGDRSQKLKPTSNLPFLCPERTTSDTDIKPMYITEINSRVETRLWSIAMDEYRTERVINIPENPSLLLSEALETEEREVANYEHTRKVMRSKYHRVKISQALSLEERVHLAKQGLWAKRFKEEEWMKARRKEQKLPFHWETPVEDIDTFLDNKDVYGKVQGLSEPDCHVDVLLREANRLVGNPGKGVNTLTLWKQTKLYEALDFMSDIALELAIANKQHCLSGSGILKKLRYFNAYILIFPTNSNEHVFFSLFVPNPSNIFNLGLPFRELIKTPEGYVTTITSAKQSKLENWSSMSSSLISLASFWSWFYELPRDTPEEFSQHRDASRMLLLSLLIRLEDKACTEESITQSRYMYMEIFKSSILPFPPDPMKLLSKLTDRCRSRLQLWCQKRMVLNFSCMARYKPIQVQLPAEQLVEGEDALPKDYWSGLLNCFTGGEVRSASKVVNLFYLGYLKNKNESPEGNTDFQLLEKTLEEEFKLDIANIHKSRGEASVMNPPKDKQFSKTCIKHGCKAMENKLERTLGENWKSIVEREIYDSLSRHSTEAIATLKASSSIQHEDSPSEAKYDAPIAAMRIKVLEAVSHKLELLKLNPFLCLDKILSHIENTSGGVISDLFKKQQHGGLREIYVLTLESRIVQLYIETISRVLCSYFEEETLTHPRNKLKKLDEHRRISSRIATKRNGLSVDLCSSSDKTRWNQNFVMPAMVIPLLRLTPHNMHNSIIRILNLWSRKLIKIPQSVIRLLLSRTELTSPTYTKLSNLFWNENPDIPIFDSPMGSFVRLQSGMMQGILHYTSSLLHLSFLYSSNKVSTALLQRSFPELKFHITQICSSDDSATILTVHSEKDSTLPSKEMMLAVARGCIMLETLNRVCGMYCMRNSVKSVTAVPNYVEFNSEFLFNNTLSMAVIKFLAATLTMTESESFLDRFHTQYNLISDLFGSGFTAEHTHLAQLAQANFHYKTLGSSTNSLFSEWTERAVQFPDPVFGFFVLDVDLMPGCLGFSFPHWIIASSTPIFQYKARALHQHPWVVTPDGGVTQSLVLKHGDVKRWRTLIQNVRGDLDLEDEIERDPSLLFRRPMTVEELRVKLALKSTLPGVGKSVQRGNPFIQSLAMSVYAINTHSFSSTTVTQDETGISKEKKKVCLLGEMDRLLSRAPVNLRKELMLVSFPNADRYEEAYSVVQGLRGSRLVHCHSFRNRKTEVMVQNRVAALPLNLYEVLTHCWFNFPIKASQKVYDRCLTAYRGTLGWIQETIEESLRLSPFITYQELYNFISMDGLKPRLFRRNGPAIHSRRLKGQLVNLMRKSQRPSCILREARGVVTPVLNDLVSSINLSLSIPEARVREQEVMSLLTTSDKLYDDLASISNMTRRDATLSYIQGIVRGDFMLEEASVHMRAMRLGAHVSFIKEQDWELVGGVRRWVGKGTALILVESSTMIVEFDGHDVVSISVDDWMTLKSNVASWNHLARELGVRSIPSSAQPGRLVAKWNGLHVVRPQDIGTPIYQLTQTHRLHFDIERMKVVVNQNELSIVQEIGPRNYPTEVNVLKYRQSGGDILLSKPGPPCQSVWQSWIKQSSVAPEAMRPFLMRARSIKRTNPAVYSWLRETLQARLQYLGYYASNLTSKLPEELEEQLTEEIDIGDDEVEAIMNQFNSDLLGNKMRFLETMDEARLEEHFQTIDDEAVEATLQDLGVNVDLPLWLNVVRNWEDIDLPVLSSVLPVRGISFMCLHPLWNDVIELFANQRSGFWHAIAEGKVIAGLTGPCRDFLDLLSIPERTIPRPGALDRYLKATELKDYLPDPDEEVRELVEEQGIEGDEGTEFDLDAELQELGF